MSEKGLFIVDCHKKNIERFGKDIRRSLREGRYEIACGNLISRCNRKNLICSGMRNNENM